MRSDPLRRGNAGAKARRHNSAERRIMPRKYATDTDAEIIEFCLNCKQKRCIGHCDALAKEKKRIAKNNEKKEKSK